MPAPSAGLLTATRTGTAHRHLFLLLEHPAGDVAVWDGIGDFELDSVTYTGVGGLGFVAGLSDSADIQQHEVTCTLNAVPLSALAEDTGDVRGAPAQIVMALIDETGAIVHQRTRFTGVGDVLRTKYTDTLAQLTLTLRSFLADWGAAPKRYYTPQDQERLHSGDTGFDYVKGLQDSAVSGWSINEETSGAAVNSARAVTPSMTSGVAVGRCLYNSLTGRAVGHGTHGMSTHYNSNFKRSLPTPEFYVEDVTAATPTEFETGGVSFLRFGSVSPYTDVYVALSGNVRTQGGKLVKTATNPTVGLREAGEITSDGSATAQTLGMLTWAAGVTVLGKTGGSVGLTVADATPLVFDNYEGRFIFADGTSTRSTIKYTAAGANSSVTYVEEVTGAAVIIGSGKLRVGGADCVVSTTGVILSPNGRRIIRSGGNRDTQFLRVWT